MEQKELPMEKETPKLLDNDKNSTSVNTRKEIPKDIMAPVEISNETISIDDIFSGSTRKQSNSNEDQKIAQRIAEFRKNQSEKTTEHNTQANTTTSTTVFKQSDISLDSVFNANQRKPSKEKDEPTKSEEGNSTTVTTTQILQEISPSVETPNDAINIDDIFSKGSRKRSDSGEDQKIAQRITEFRKNRSETEHNAQTNTTTSTTVFEQSDISLDSVFNMDQNKPSEEKEEPTKLEEGNSTTVTTTQILQEIPPSVETPNDAINIDDIFTISSRKQSNSGGDDKIAQRIAEFRKNKSEKSSQHNTQANTTTSTTVFEKSTILLDDILNFEKKSTPENENKSSEDKVKRDEMQNISTTTTFERSDISLDNVFNNSIPFAESREDDTNENTRGSNTIISVEANATAKKSEISNHDTTSVVSGIPNEKMKPAKSENEAIPEIITSTEFYTNYDVKQEEFIDDMQTTIMDMVFETASTSKEWRTETNPEESNNFLSPDHWQDSIRSTSTISLDDLPIVTRRNELRLPTDEMDHKSPTTPTKQLSTVEYYPSPTRVSSEIKYEWVADILEQSTNPRDSWISSVTYTIQDEEEEPTTSGDLSWIENVFQEMDVIQRTTRMTTTTTTTTTEEDECSDETDEQLWSRVFECFECVDSGENSDEKCHCSACRLTRLSPEELEDLKRKWRERKKIEQVRQPVGSDAGRRSTIEPSHFSIDDIFSPPSTYNLQLGQEIFAQVEGALPPNRATTALEVSTRSSPPPTLTNQTTTQLSPTISETITTTHRWKDDDTTMFSPQSDRRFSNFYDDRTGWDTMGSEDSGVMSGGGRRSSRQEKSHIVIDEVFDGLYKPNTEISIETTPYDDFYITSLREDGDEADDEVDPTNLDVSQFVDDILGKSLDEAAFLSSTKSHRGPAHTDTSIDRRNVKEHEFYRKRTDTSIDRRSKEKHDDLMRLVFIDSRRKDESKGEACDEELLEIEIQPGYFLIKGSYSLVIPKSDPLGQVLQKISEQKQSLATLDFSLTRKLKKLIMSCVMEKALGGQISKAEGVSTRGNALISSVDHASATFLQMNANKFDPILNPKGIVNFCTAENNICSPLLEEHFKHLELFFPTTEHLVRYPPSGGWPQAREALCAYFSKFLSANVDPSELVLTASARTGYDVVSYSLFEESDVLLTNGPIYTGTISNPNERAQCVVEVVPTDLRRPRIEIAKYQEQFARLTREDRVVAGVIIVNPHNPLGVVFPPGDVIELCNWAAANNLYVIIDEVFANCVFDSSSPFKSYLSYRDLVSHPEKVAYLWSVSKDFGLPGMKFAVIHSPNEALRKAATKLQFYHPCSPFVQDFAVKLLSDFDWLQDFHGEVKRRIRIHYEYTVENLRRLNIDSVAAEAGIFVFANFTPYLPKAENGEKGELSLWDRLADGGVMLTPGVHQKCHEFGWMRLVFACSKEELKEGIRRLYRILGSSLEPIGNVKY